MDKKIVIAELDYIFNLVKGSFDVKALAKYLTASGQWNKFIYDKAKSYGINVDDNRKVEKKEDYVKFDFEKEVKKQVRSITDKNEGDGELVEDWVMAYMFLPEALDKLSQDEETGEYHWKGTGITGLIDRFQQQQERGKDREHSFVGLFKRELPNVIKKYLRIENKENGIFVNDNADKITKNYMQKDIKKQPARDKDDDSKEDLSHIDLDQIADIGDFRDNHQLKELTDNAQKYVNKHAPEDVAKVFNLRLEDEYMPFEEIAEKLKKDKSTISKYLNQLAKILLDFAHKEDNAELYKLIEKMIEKTKEIPKDKKAASIARLSYVITKLERAFTEAPNKDAVKIASITKYINTLCDKIS